MHLSTAGAAFCGLLVPGVVSTLQSSHSDEPNNQCGPLALSACVVSIGRGELLTEIDRRFPPGPMTSLQSLKEFLDDHAVPNVAVHWEHDPLPFAGGRPAIIPIRNADGQRHFVALLQVVEGAALIYDVPRSPQWVPLTMLWDSLHWTGEALHVADDPAELPGFASDVSGPKRWWWLAALAAILGILDWAIRSRRPDAKRV